eukprot:scaffold210859_cov27-Tisochrysis_lutea.AAC.2
MPSTPSSDRTPSQSVPSQSLTKTLRLDDRWQATARRTARPLTSSTQDGGDGRLTSRPFRSTLEADAGGRVSKLEHPQLD